MPIVTFLFAATLSVPAVSSSDAAVAAVLERQTQALMDAVGAGDAAVWDRYLDPRARVVDENGAVMTKQQMVEGTKPLPEGVSGSIRVTGFEATVHGDVAVATHVEDEHENFHGHALHCQYRTTDTWLKTADGWRLLASQVLALRTDPPAAALARRLRDEYVGRYELAPGIAYEIRKSGDGLEGVRTGRQPEELRAEAPDVLFVPGQPRYRKVVVRDGDGRITGFADRREAWDLVWKRAP